LGTYRGHEGTVYCIDAFSSTSSPSRVSLPISSAKISPSHNDTITLITGSHDQSVLIWQITLGDTLKVDQQKRLKGHTGDVYALQVCQDDLRHQLLTAGDYTLKVWNMDTGLHTSLTGHTGFISCLRIRGRRAWTGSWDGTLRSWNLAFSKPMHLFTGHKSIVNCVDVSDTDVFSGSWDMTVIQWSRAVWDEINVDGGYGAYL
jgi:WD40 repeat protein